MKLTKDLWQLSFIIKRLLAMISGFNFNFEYFMHIFSNGAWISANSTADYIDEEGQGHNDPTDTVNRPFICTSTSCQDA